MAERLAPGSWGEITTRQTVSPSGVISWIARASYHDPNTGRNRDVTSRDSTEPKAKNRLRGKLANLTAQDTAGDITSRSTVGELLDAWLAEKANGDISEAAVAAYRRTIDRHLKPAIGAVECRNLRAQAVDRILTELQTPTEDARNNHGIAEARRVRAIMNGSVKLAHRYEAITRILVFAGIRKARYEIRTLTLADIKTMLDAADEWVERPRPHGPKSRRDLPDLLTIMLASGLRIGEALALRTGDITPPPEAGLPWLVTVTGTIQSRTAKPGLPALYRKPDPKSSSSNRTVPVADMAGEILQRRLDSLADADEDALVFHTSKGTPLHPANIRRTWRSVRRQDHVDLDWVVPHTLRKTLATLVASEINPEAAARFIGHGRGTGTLHAHYVRLVHQIDPAYGSVLNALDPRHRTGR